MRTFGPTRQLKGVSGFGEAASRRATGGWATTPSDDQYAQPPRSTEGYGRILQLSHAPSSRLLARPVHDPRRTRPRRHGVVYTAHDPRLKRQVAITLSMPVGMLP